MANYGINYRLDFCDVLGVKKRIDILKRDYTGVITPFVGSGNPISLTYHNEQDEKFNQITVSEATIRIISSPVLDLNTFYSEDERMWLVKFYSGDFIGNNWDDTRNWKDVIPWEDFTPNEGTHLAWTGYLMPDRAREPFKSIYEFQIEASDVLGTLKTIPYVNPDTTVIKKVDSLKNILIECLNRAELQLNVIISTDTFETTMLQSGNLDCPLEQTYVDTTRFIDGNNKPYSCYDIIKHICNQFTANVKQINGRWYFVDITQYAKTSFTGREYTSGFSKVGFITISGIKTVEPDNLVNADGTNEKEPAYKIVTSYYQFGRLSNAVFNGDFKFKNPTGSPQIFPGWTAFGGVALGFGQKSITTKEGVTPIEDYYAVITNKNLEAGITSDPISVMETNTINVSVLAKKFDLTGGYRKFYSLNMMLTLSAPGKPNYYWSGNANKWVLTNTSAENSYVQLRLSINDFVINGANASFTAGYPVYEGTLRLTIFGVAGEDVEATKAIIDDASIKLDESQYYRSPIGSVTQLVNLDQHSKSPDPVVLMFGDDQNKSRTSWMRNNAGTPTQLWVKKGIPGYIPLRLQQIVAKNILTQYQKQSRRFEGSFRGDFMPIDSLIIPLTEGKFMFLSGSFDVKSAISKLVLAEVFTNEFTGFNMTNFDDSGDFKDSKGSPVGSASGVSFSVPPAGGSTEGLIKSGPDYQPDVQLNIAKGTFQEELRIPKAGGGTRKIYIA